MSRKKIKLFKRPTDRYQHIQTFTVSMEEFIEMAQGRIDQILVHDSLDRCKAKLEVKDLLKKAHFNPYLGRQTGYGYLVVNYEALNKDIPLEKRKPKKENTSSACPDCGGYFLGSAVGRFLGRECTCSEAEMERFDEELYESA